jgi:hypothetical protein
MARIVGGPVDAAMVLWVGWIAENELSHFEKPGVWDERGDGRSCEDYDQVEVISPLDHNFSVIFGCGRDAGA